MENRDLQDFQAPLDLLALPVGLTTISGLIQSGPHRRKALGRTMDQALGMATMTMPRPLTLTTEQTAQRQGPNWRPG